MQRFLGAGLTMWVTAACVPPMPGEVGPVEAAADAGTPADAGEQCPAHTDGTCPDVSWVVSDAFPYGVEDHTTAVLTRGDQAYALVGGGMTAAEGHSATIRSVMRAPILAGGLPGAWNEEATLPHPMAQHAQAQTSTHVYYVGGVTTENTVQVPHKGAVLGRLNAQGHVTLTELPSLIHPAVHASASVAQGWLVVAGGSVDGAQTTVQMAALREDGMALEFQDAARLPQARSHHAAVVWNGRIYLVGGFDADGEAVTQVLRSVHAGDGKLVGWEDAGAMPVAPRAASAFVHNGRIYVVGGGMGGPTSEVFADSIWRCTPDGHGMTMQWDVVTDALPQPHANVRMMPVYGDHVLSVGGRPSTGLMQQGDVLVGHLW